MVTRRAFLRTTSAAGASLLAGPAHLGAQSYDLLVKGGRVIDPAARVDRVMDVAIRGGRIAAVGTNLAGAKETIDATGKLVVPGLIDIHTHARTMDMPGICLSQGVTSLVDGGSKGADEIDQIVAVAKAAPNRVRILLNLARTGILPDGELMDISRADVEAGRQALARHRDVIIGVKARLSDTVAGKNDLEAVRRARAIVEPFNLSVMVHVGQSVSPMSAILALLEPGDVVTHLYAPPPNSIFDEKGAVLPEVLAARKRGIWFDVGHGSTRHLSWKTMEDGLRAGFLPDTISSDWTDAGRALQVVDFPNILSKFLLLGMPLDQVIATGTNNAARVFPVYKDFGTLKVGAVADVTVLERRTGTFEFVDNYGTKRTGSERLIAAATVFGGKRTPPSA